MIKTKEYSINGLQSLITIKADSLMYGGACEKQANEWIEETFKIIEYRINGDLRGGKDLFQPFLKIHWRCVEDEMTLNLCVLNHTIFKGDIIRSQNGKLGKVLNAGVDVMTIISVSQECDREESGMPPIPNGRYFTQKPFTKDDFSSGTYIQKL